MDVELGVPNEIKNKCDVSVFVDVHFRISNGNYFIVFILSES